VSAKSCRPAALVHSAEIQIVIKKVMTKGDNPLRLNSNVRLFLGDEVP